MLMPHNLVQQLVRKCISCTRCKLLKPEEPLESDDEGDEVELSASQIQQFEAENARFSTRQRTHSLLFRRPKLICLRLTRR